MLQEKIRFLRRKHLLSQEALAEILSVSTVHLSHIETGRSLPSLKEINILANYFGVSIETLLEEKHKDYDEIIVLLNNCTPTQMQILLKLLRVQKGILDDYLIK